MHAARWMSKAIYSLKVWMFRSQFGKTGKKSAAISPEECDKLFQVCIFIVSTYVEAWYDAPSPASAARSDLQLAARVEEFADVNARASEVAAKKLSSHLYYLSEELVGLAVFDEGLSDEVRRELVGSIQNKLGLDDPMKKREISFAELLKTNIEDLGTTHTQTFFKIVGIEIEFFDAPVGTWSQNDDYVRGKKVVDALQVVNDHAERSVKLIQDYNRILKSEENFQNLLLTVSGSRKSFPDSKKSTVLKRYTV